MATAPAAGDDVVDAEDARLQPSGVATIASAGGSSASSPPAQGGALQGQHENVPLTLSFNPAGLAGAAASYAASPTPDSAVPDPVRDIQDLLVERYGEQKLDVDSAMLRDGVEPTVANLHINIIMLPRTDLGQEFSEQRFDSVGDLWRVEHAFARAADRLEPVALESLFDHIPDKIVQQKATFRIFAIASGGCGKTTAFTKVAPLRWAVQGMWRQHFDLVFARELRDEEAREARSIADLFDLEALGWAGGGSGFGKDRRVVEQFIRRNPHRVCLVLDGLDETSLAKCSAFVRKIIKGDELSGIRLVVTSRPSDEMLTLCKSKSLDGRVELVGFRPEEVEVYVRRLMNDSVAEPLLSEVWKDKQLHAMMCTPIMAYEICKLYFHCKRVPHCVSDIFDLMILRLAERRSGVDYDNWRQIPAYIRCQVLELGKFAFDMLRAQQLVFNQEELQDHTISQEAVQLGFLLSSDWTPGSRSKQWRFCHLTLQESLAARYVACSDLMCPHYIVHMVESLGPESGHLRTFWIMLAAQVNQQCLETLVNALLTRNHQRHRQLTAYRQEHDRLAFPLNFVRMLCEQLNRDALDWLANFLECPPDLVTNKMTKEQAKSGSHEQFLRTLLLTWKEEQPEASELSLLEAVGRVNVSARQACKIRLDASVSHERSLLLYEAINLSNVRPDIALHCFSEHARYRHDGCQPVASISVLLQAYSVDAPLRVSSKTNPALVRAIDSVLAHHPGTLQHVEISGFEKSKRQFVPESLGQWRDLHCLRIDSCLGQGQVLAKVVESSATTLDTLLSTASFSSQDAPQLAASLELCQQLTECFFDEAVGTLSALFPALAALPNLSKIRLKGLTGVEPEVAPDVSPLRNCREVRIFSLQSVILKSSTVKTLINFMTSKSWSRLRRLNLGDCKVVPTAVQDWQNLFREADRHRVSVDLSV